MFRSEYKHAKLKSRRYYSLLKIVLNGKKITCITPIYHMHKFVSTHLTISSELSSVLTVHTKLLLQSFHFSVDHVGEIIKNWIPTKLMSMIWLACVCSYV